MPGGFLDPAGALFGAPDLLASPQLALAAGDSPDPVASGQVLAHTANTVAQMKVLQDNADRHGDGFVHELFGSIGHSIHSVLHVAGEGLHQLARPLGDVQHDYRYLRDVYQNHGFFAGAAETLGIVAAGTVGGLVGGSLGATVAAEAAASLEQRLFYKDSADRTRDSSAPGYVRGVSPGRDLSRLLSNVPGLGALGDTQHGWGKVLSGTGDLAFDFTADPVIVGFKAQALRHSALGWTEMGAYKRAVNADRMTAFRSFVDQYAPGRGIELGNVGRVDAAYKTDRQYNRALQVLGQEKNGAGAVIAMFPNLKGLAPELGAAKTAEEAHEVFRQAAFDKDMNDRITGALLPSRALIRVPFAALAEHARMIGGDAATPMQQGVIKAIGSSVMHPTEAKDILAGAAARKVRTFTGVMPFAINKAGEISTKEFNPDTVEGLPGMLNAFRFGMGEKRARYWVDQFAAETNLGKKKAIYREGLMEMYKASGVADSPQLVAHIHALTGDAIEGSSDAGLYGIGKTLGVGVSTVEHGEGSSQLALYDFQHGNWAFPDFFQLKNAVRDTNRFTKLYGNADDFMAHYYTNGFFKPLALVTMGFGLRVAASEAIPGVMRYGLLPILASRVGASAAKHGYQVQQGEELYRLAQKSEAARIAAEAAGDTELAARHGAAAEKFLAQADKTETGHIMSAMARLAGGMDKLLNDPETHDLYARAVMQGGGQFVRGAVATQTHTASAIDVTTRAEGGQWGLHQQAMHNVPFQADTSSFKALTRDVNQYQDYWHAALQRRANEPSVQLIARDILDAHKRIPDPVAMQQHVTRLEGDRIRNVAANDPYAKGRRTIARYQPDVQNPDEFATHRVDDVLNHVTGDNGVLHTDLLEHLAAGRKPTREMLDAIDVEARPGKVIGHGMIPLTSGNLLQRGVNLGFKRLVDPMISYISREPIYGAALKQNYKMLSAAVDKRLLTEEEALTRATYRSIEDMIPQIHNTMLRSQFAQLMRNYLPFYFAQEQALKRAGTLISKHPAALEQYQLIHHGITDPNFVHVDDQGNRHLMIPLASGIGGHFLNAASAIGLPLQGGLPLSVSGDMASLKTVMPEIQQPGVTPIAGIALNRVAHFFPEYSPEVKGVVGERGFGRSIADQLIPNAPLRNIVKGLRADEADRSFSSAFATALASASFHGKVPPPDASPAEQQAFIDRIKNDTRSMFFIKAVLSALSPLSPTVTQEDPGLLDEFHKLVKEKGSYGAGVQAFLERHGDKGISYTVAKSETTNGAQIPYTNAAIAFVNAHEKLITSGDTQLAAAALVPQEEGAGDVQTIHDEMLRMHLRARRTPEQFRDALYVQQGNRQYFADYAKHKEAVTALAGNTAGLAAENASWQDYVAGMQNANPIWAAEFYSPVKAQRARKTLEQLQTMFDSGQAPAGTQTDLVRGLLEDYRGHNLALVSFDPKSGGHQRQVERDAWDAWLDQRAAEEPRLASLISSVFKQLGRTG